MYAGYMRKRTWSTTLSIAGIALLATSCAAETSDVEGATGASSQSEASSAGDAEAVEQQSELLSEEHVAEGVELPECLDSQGDIYVQSGTVLNQDELLDLCPAEPSEDRVFRPSQQIIAGEGVEIRYLSGEEGAGEEVHHLHCEDEDALDEKAEHNGESQPKGSPQDWDGSGAMPDPYCHPDYLEIGEWEHLETHSACWEGTETSTLVDDGQSQDEINAFLWDQSQARADWEPQPSGGTCAEQWAENDGGDPEDYADIGNADEG